MLTLDTTLAAYFNARRTIEEVTLIWIRARLLSDDSAVAFGFWNGDRSPTITVPDGKTGANVARLYYGYGSLMSDFEVASAPSFSELNAVTLDFNASDDYVVTKLRTANLRNASVEVHKGYLHEDTHNLIAMPMIVYRGKIDGVDFTASALDVGGGPSDGESLAVTVSPSIRMTKINTKTRSRGVSESRSNDSFYKWAGVSAKWKLWWGKKRKAHGGSDDDGGHHSRGHNGTHTDTYTDNFGYHR